jgi:hypothetical protein
MKKKLQSGIIFSLVYYFYTDFWTADTVFGDGALYMYVVIFTYWFLPGYQFCS